MKTKLHFGVFFVLLLVSSQLQAQSQLWALTTEGGAYNQGAILQANNDGSGPTVMFSFQSPEGFHPYGDLLQASDGNLYGTCWDGGQFFSCTVFRFDPSTGTYIDVYDFDITHGDFPRSGVIEGPNGILYGAASAGGSHYAGVIYSYDMNTGIYTDLYDMETLTGSTPYGSPVLCNGKLYGMTNYGGAHSRGVIYSYDIATNTYQDVLDFNGPVNSLHEGNLLLASNGLLYGMSSGTGVNGYGVIFSFDPVTNTYTKLHDFDGVNGKDPKGGLIEGSNGLLYGMTYWGGVNQLGTMFSFDISTGVLNKLHDFNTLNGQGPWGNLKQSGNLLCGTTSAGGANGHGVIFNYDIAANAYYKVHDFNGTDGSKPTGGFIAYQTTGIPTVPANDISISIFPNPVTNYLYITNNAQQVENTTVYLKDISGKIIHATSMLLQSNQSETIDLSGYCKGTYLLEIRSANRITVKKIVKI